MADWHPLIKVLHILSATLLFGTGLGTAFQMWSTHKGSDVAAIARVARQVVWADWLFTTPAVIAQPVTGLMLIYALGYDPWEPWLLAVYVLYALAGACWLPVVWIQLRVRDLARAAADSGTPLPAAYYHLMRWWFWLGWPAFGAVIAIFWLMVDKPAL
jgi:uncharacterized membrane protein